MSVAAELQAAARAIRTQQATDATFHQRVADLLDQVALSAPLVVHHNGASPFMPPITRKALAVARAYRSPGASLKTVDRCICRGPIGSVQCVVHGVRPVVSCGQGGVS